MRSPVTTSRRSRRPHRSPAHRPTSGSRSRMSLLWGIVGDRADRRSCSVGLWWTFQPVRPAMSERRGTASSRPAVHPRAAPPRRATDAASEPVIRTRRLTKKYGDADGGRPARPRGLPGRDLRAARPERRRQDDHDPDAPRAVRADRRRGAGHGARPGLGAARGQAPGRLPARRGRLLRRT